MPSGFPEDWYNRFWYYVDLPEGDKCWEWRGDKTRWGYGRLTVDGKKVLAHRLAWIEHYGDIPNGLQVLHSCDNPPCCRYDHLFLGTNTDNRHDSARKHRTASGERHGIAVLTWDTVHNMRSEYVSLPRITYTELARRYGVSLCTAWNVINKVTWKE